MLSAIRVGIRIDISSATPFSKYAQQQALDGLFDRGAITFEEYVGAMEDDSGLPKGKLLDILRARAAAATAGMPAAPRPCGNRRDHSNGRAGSVRSRARTCAGGSCAGFGEFRSQRVKMEMKKWKMQMW